MATTNVFFEFPCFIERWLVNANDPNRNNPNNINSEYFVNKNDVIGHVRLDNQSIVNFRAPVSGYLTIIIRENVRVQKGLSVAAIHPHSTRNRPQIIQNQAPPHPNLLPPQQHLIRIQPQFQMQPNMNMHPQTLPPQHLIHHSHYPQPQIRQIIHPPQHAQIQYIHPGHPHPMQQPQHQNVHFRPPPIHHQNITSQQIIHHQPPPPPQQQQQSFNPNPNISHPQQPPPQQPQSTNIQMPQLQSDKQSESEIGENIKPNSPKIEPNETKTNKELSPSKPIVSPKKYPKDPRNRSANNTPKTMPKMPKLDKSESTTPNTMFTKLWKNKRERDVANNKESSPKPTKMCEIRKGLHRDKKLLLVLDIDHTLVHATRDLRAKDTLQLDGLRDDVHEIAFVDPSCNSTQKQTYWVKLRPFLRKFLQVLKRFFCLAIYTMGIRPYAREILKIIDPNSTIFEHRMICRGDSGINQVNNMKDISHLPQCDPKMILIADDRDDVWTTPMNVVKVHKFRYWPNENNLADGNGNEPKEPINKVIMDENERLFPWNVKSQNEKIWNMDALAMKANDNILYNTANILQAVHYVYYSDPQLNEDCRLIYGDMKKQIFKGCKCAFSGCIPTNEDPRNHPLWKLIKAYGGEPVDSLSSDITHLIAAKPGTFKVSKAQEMNVWVVHFNWVYQSVIEFARCNEMMHQDLNKVGNVSSFVPKHIHVKPKEFGDRIKGIRNGKVMETKVIRKDERIKIMRDEKVRQIAEIQRQRHLEIERIEQQKREQMEMERKKEKEKEKETVTDTNTISMDIEKDGGDESEEGEIREEPMEIVKEEKSNKAMDVDKKENEKSHKKVQNVTVVINNNTKNNVVIQLPPSNHQKMENKPPINGNSQQKQSSSEILPNYIQLPAHLKTQQSNQANNANDIPPSVPQPQRVIQSLPAHITLPERKLNNQQQPPQSTITNQLPVHITLPKKESNIQQHAQPQSEGIAQPLPAHIALPTKSSPKILARHQNTNTPSIQTQTVPINQNQTISHQQIRSPSNNPDQTNQINQAQAIPTNKPQHQNVSPTNQTQINPINKSQTQIIPSPKLSNVQIPKPQIIQIQQPTLNHLAYRVPVIPQHLRPPIINPNPQNIIQQPQHPNSYIPPSMMPPQPSPQQIPIQIVHPPVHTMPTQQIPTPTQQIITQPPTVPLNNIGINNQPKVIEEENVNDRDYRKFGKDRNLRDRHRDRRDSDSDHRRDRDHRRRRRSSSSRSGSRSRSSRSSRSYRKNQRYSRSRSRSRSPRNQRVKYSNFSSLNSSNSSSSYKKRNDRRRARKEEYQIIGGRGGDGEKIKYQNNKKRRRSRYNKKNNHEWDEQRTNDDADDPYAALLQSYMGDNGSNKYSRYSDEEKIDYGVGTNENKANDDGDKDMIDYGAI